MPTNILAAIEEFLRVLRAGRESGSTKPVEDLTQCLDLLAYLAHDVTCDFDDAEYPDPPEIDGRATYLLCEKWLPYDGIKGSSLEPYAAMDLSELTDDLIRIHWRFKNTSESDALWHYQFGFRSHWGHHLRSVQNAIHDWYW